MKKFLFLIMSLMVILPCRSKDYVNYIKVGTEWTVDMKYPGDPGPDGVSRWTVRYVAEKDTLVDERTGVVISDGSGMKAGVLSCTDGKVYVLNERYPDLPAWRLLYDFDLESGESICVAVQDLDSESVVQYKESGFLGSGYEVPYIRVFDLGPDGDFGPDEDMTAVWLPGIGSTWGLFENVSGWLSGGFGSQLREVVSNGVTVYSSSDVNEVKKVEYVSTGTEIYDLNGMRIKHPLKGGLYIIDGKKTLCRYNIAR